MRLISLIIPTFHELQMTDTLQKVLEYLKSLPQYKFEIILVDDSSERDHHALCEEIRSLRTNPSCQIRILAGEKTGKGSAIQKGVFIAKGDIVFYSDADFTIPISNIPIFIDRIVTENCDIVAGERPFRISLQRLVESPARFILSFGLLVAQRYFIFHSRFFLDTQCGFKAFRASAIRELAKLQRVSGGMFDIEYLYIAKIRGLKTVCQRVECLPELRKSKIRILRCIFQDPIELLKVKCLGVLGRYSPPINGFGF